MKSFICDIESFRIGDMESVFNHISIPINFEILVGGKWMKGKIFYHHYHRSVSYDSNLAQIIQHCTADKREELRLAIVQFVEEKTNRGLALSRPPITPETRIEA
ncbi:hypothetical protein FIU87_20060 [Bacillus sp. THAF10]|uniref:hypothetical protein n=1 Tax=Bacillus sp. THAF10 TaxID=2587848 RepID=UPI0012686139|nr:hypothetical protein [Bacillus sp. THAF10]QFT90946.1 hypothetical protein FIU87_20060 [Bacillus sp. THAF10]